MKKAILGLGIGKEKFCQSVDHDTKQLRHSYSKLYWYRSRWYDSELINFLNTACDNPRSGTACCSITEFLNRFIQRLVPVVAIVASAKCLWDDINLGLDW